MIKVIINGEATAVPAALESVALLDFVRDFVGLPGTKFGCGIGLCGACTVHIGGSAVRSCQISVGDVAGGDVTTIEGLAASHSDAELHPLQAAWIEDAVPQCGYCQAGQIMAAAALLAKNPTPSDADIRTEMDGNICRCGTYERIRQTIARVAREG